MKPIILIIVLTLMTHYLYSQSIDLYSFSATPEIDSIQLSWNNSSVSKSDYFEISSVIKKIGQGRKPFLNPIKLNSNFNSYNLQFEGLSDVFIRFRVMDSNHIVIYEKIERVEVIKNDVQTMIVDGRKIYIYLPPSYSVKSQPYNVMLMQDGQNLFSAGSSPGSAEWRVDETVTSLISKNKIDPLVVIGIASTDRVTSFWPKEFGYKEGKGEDYGLWITEKLVPLILHSFNVKKTNWSAAGSSYGAVISLYLGFKYRNIFSKIGAISPAMDLGGQEFIKSQKIGLQKIYFDSGEKEQYRIINPQIFNFPNNAVELVEALIDNGYIYGKNIAFFEDSLQTSHKEDVVAARLENMILFLYNEDRVEVSMEEFHSETFIHKKNVVKKFSDGFRLTLIE